MPVRLARFEMPKRLQKEDATATSTYAKFSAEPFETGYGHTIGNSLRRVLLSSLEGAAITSVKIEGAQHEFAIVDGVVEDVTEIVLNLKKIKFKCDNHEPQQLILNVNKDGQVTAADIELNQHVTLVNPEQVFDIERGLREVLLNPDRRRWLLEAGHAQVRRFHWETTARQVLSIYRETAGIISNK